MTVAEAHKDQVFPERFKKAEWWTDMWMRWLYSRNYFTEYKKAKKSDDKEGIDYWVKFFKGDEWHSIQFKLRVDANNKKRDCPVLRDQPFRGSDVPYTDLPTDFTNTIGRDYKEIMESKSEYYFVAAKNDSGLYDEIYMFETNRLREIILKGEEEWDNVEKYIIEDDGHETQNYKWFLKRDSLVQSVVSKIWKATILFQNEEMEIWLQKNGIEKYRKINFYIKERLKKDSCLIPQATAMRVRRLYQSVFKEN